MLMQKKKKKKKKKNVNAMQLHPWKLMVSMVTPMYSGNPETCK